MLCLCGTALEPITSLETIVDTILCEDKEPRNSTLPWKESTDILHLPNPLSMRHLFLLDRIRNPRRSIIFANLAADGPSIPVQSQAVLALLEWELLAQPDGHGRTQPVIKVGPET